MTVFLAADVVVSMFCLSPSHTQLEEAAHAQARLQARLAAATQADAEQAQRVADAATQALEQAKAQAAHDKEVRVTTN